MGLPLHTHLIEMTWCDALISRVWFFVFCEIMLPKRRFWTVENVWVRTFVSTFHTPKCSIRDKSDEKFLQSVLPTYFSTVQNLRLGSIKLVTSFDFDRNIVMLSSSWSRPSCYHHLVSSRDTSSFYHLLSSTVISTVNITAHVVHARPLKTAWTPFHTVERCSFHAISILSSNDTSFANLVSSKDTIVVLSSSCELDRHITAQGSHARPFNTARS